MQKNWYENWNVNINKKIIFHIIRLNDCKSPYNVCVEIEIAFKT